MENEVWEIFTAVIEDFNAGVEDNDKLIIERSTKLFGPGSSVDSMSLVNIVLSFEDRLFDVYDVEVSLSDDEALNQSKSPYESLGLLSEYATKILKTKK